MSNARFVKKLIQQLRYLNTSCEAYDNGQLIEAHRIAVSLRVLFHDTSRSKSLASHLGMKDWEIFSTPPSLVENRISNIRFLSINLDFKSPTPISCLPALGQQFLRVSLQDWWGVEDAFTLEGKSYSRKDLILSLANKEGGAHVDDKSDDFYIEMESGLKSISIDARNLTYDGEPPFELSERQYAANPHLAMVRQFAHEVITTASIMKWASQLEFSKYLKQATPYWRNIKK
jgi:hypothetical protein